MSFDQIKGRITGLIDEDKTFEDKKPEERDYSGYNRAGKIIAEFESLY